MLHEVHVGDGAPPRVLGPVTRTDIVRYQGASGDFQPIHHDEPYALAAGFPAPIAVGMFTAGALSAWATDWLGPENVRRVKFRFRAPVYPGDVISLSGRVTRVFEGSGAERRADVELSAAHASGTLAVSGEATFVVSPTSALGDAP